MNTKQLFEVIWEKSKLNLKSEASSNYLSYLWWFVEPIINMACYFVVFDLLLQRGGPGFVYFLLVGLVPWLWFARTVSQGANSLMGGRFLMAQLYIDKLFFPLVFIAQCSVKQLLVFGVLLLFLLVTGHGPSIHWLGGAVILITQLLFMIPVACLCALAVVFVRDMKFVIPTVIQLLFFSSGVFFSLDSIPSQYKAYLFLNPMAGIIDAYRDVLLKNQWPDWSYLAIVSLLSFAMIGVVILLYRKNDYVIARLTQE